MRRAQHDGVGQAVEGEIVEILAGASQETPVLAPLRRVANAGSANNGSGCHPHLLRSLWELNRRLPFPAVRGRLQAADQVSER
jgi:hypothetical protein